MDSAEDILAAVPVTFTCRPNACQGNSRLTLLFAAPSGWADDLAQVKEKGVLRFALSGQYPPFNFVNENNQLTGFDVEIGAEIGRRIGVKGTPISTAWDGIIAGLLANKYELICGSMAITPARIRDRIRVPTDRLR